MPAAAAKESILVVDDEPQILVALEDLLSSDFVVFKSESAEQALNLMTKRRDIAVVISDQRMPGMPGDRMFAALGDAYHALRILLTGFADLSAVTRAVNDGKLFAYVTKPWNSEDLHLKVRRAAEHFRLARELDQERQLLHDLMNNLPDGVYFKDRDLRFIRANRHYAELVAAAPARSLIGRRLTEIGADPRRDEAIEMDERDILARQTPVTDAIRDYGVGDERRWFSETTAPILSDGEVIGLVGVSRDVTQRFKIEEALRASEERLRAQTRVLTSILDGMGDGVLVTDRAGKVLSFNSQAERILGSTPRDAAPEDWPSTYGLYSTSRTALIPPEEAPLKTVLADGVPRQVEAFVKNEKVPGTVVTITATPLLDDARQLVGGIALLSDITRRRHLEEQLAQAQKMEAIGILAGGVAHDFNNLLAVITSYAELALQGLAPSDSVRDDLDELLSASRRAASLTGQLLAFSRRQVFEPRPLNLNDTVANLEKMLRRIVGEDIELATRLDQALGLVRADPGQIDQIIMNLAVNARDAMPEGGRLIIETKNAHFDRDYVEVNPGVEPGPAVMLSVVDTGSGMDAATQKRVFEPFFTTKAVGKGTGLGLSTVYGIVQQSNGHISIESELGKGTCIRVYLPQISASAVVGDVQIRRTSRNPSAGTLSILLVEDDPAVRRVAVRILRDQGYVVHEAKYAAEALELCAGGKLKLDLLLTDMIMPELSGPKLAEQLCKGLPELRVLYMSGYPVGVIDGNGAAPAGPHFIQKPFSPASLANKVREVFAVNP